MGYAQSQITKVKHVDPDAAEHALAALASPPSAGSGSSALPVFPARPPTDAPAPAAPVEAK